MPITYNIKVKKNEIIIIILILIIIMMIGTASIMRREFDNINTNAKLTHSVKKLTTAFFSCSRDKFANDKYI